MAGETDTASATEIAPPTGADVATSAAPVVEAAPAVEAVAADAPAVEAAPGEAEAEAAKADEPAVEAAAEGDKPAEPAADPEAKTDEVKAEAETPPAPTYEAFNLPEGFNAAPEQLEAFTGVLGKYGLSQEAGQELMDLHGATIKSAVEKIEQAQRDTFAETRKSWVAEFDKQAGNRRDTIINDAKWAIQQLVPDTEKRKEIWSVLAFTGAGDHPAVVQLMAAAAKKMRERPAPSAASPNDGRRGVSKADQRYGR